MSRYFAAILALWAVTTSVAAQEFSGLARVSAQQSRISDHSGGGVVIDLHLSQGVPYRLFTLDAPPRLILDFQEVDWSGLDAARLIGSDRIAGVQYGTYVPGWSRMVAQLSAPMRVEAAQLTVSEIGEAAHLMVTLVPADPVEFAVTAGAPVDARWDLPPPAELAAAPSRAGDAPMMVVLDPGHGGIDPGAETEAGDEKTLILTFARELRETLLRSGEFEVVLTRDGDHFVSLERRIAIAHEAQADVFISLHADSLAEGQAHGATVHVLSREASDLASAKLAERHDRDELLLGVDLSEADDQVTDVLLDLARQETQPRTETLAQALLDGMAQTGAPMNRRPLRRAAFSVLKAADIPSVLVEIGFMSSPRDLKNLQDSNWRVGIAHGILNGLRDWRDTDALQRPLVRQ